MANNSQKSEVPEHLLTEFKENSYQEWREAVDKLLKGKPYDKIMLTKTYENIQLEPIYRKEDTKENLFLDNLPGEFPYVRSTKKLGFIDKSWNVAQEISYASTEKFNKAVLHDLHRGQDCLNIVLDDATINAKDGNKAKTSQVGSSGLSVSIYDDLNKMFKNVMLDCVTVDIKAFSSSMYLTALYALYLKNNNIDFNDVKGSIGSDPLAQLLKNGELPCSLDKLYDEMFLTTKWVKNNIPKIKSIAVHSDIYVDSGASAVEELTFMFSSAIEYLNEMIKRGLSIDEVASRIQFNIALNSNFFMEIAKIRAARVIWANIVSAFNGNEDSQKMYIHAKTSLWNKTKYDPYVNMLRTTTEAFSGVIGGVDSLHVGHFDEVIGKPDEFSRRIARNQSVMLNEECHFNHVIDPVGGSWYIETLTNEICDNVWKAIQEIDDEGGFYKKILEGSVQNKINEVANSRIKNANVRRDIIVGTNMYANTSEVVLKDKSPEIDFFENRKKELDNIKKLENDVNSIEDFMIAFEKGSSIQYVAENFRKNEKPFTVKKLNISRIAKHFENLREKVENLAEKPKVFLAGMGPVKQFKARMDFSRGFFEVANLTVLDKGDFKSPVDAANYALELNAQVFVLCSTDDTYPEIVPDFVKNIKNKNDKAIVVLAGYPKDQIEDHKKSGIDVFIHARADVYKTINSILEKIGVGNV